MSTTIRVCDLLELVNRQNRTQTHTKEQREGVNQILNTVLHGTGNYEGFRYLEASEVPMGATPGIRWEVDQEGGRSPNFEGTDSSRIQYNWSKALQQQKKAKPVRAGIFGGVFKSMDDFSSRRADWT